MLLWSPKYFILSWWKVPPIDNDVTMYHETLDSLEFQRPMVGTWHRKSTSYALQTPHLAANRILTYNRIVYKAVLHMRHNE